MNENADSTNTTDFAVYIGESREVSRQLVESVKEMRGDLKEFRTDVKNDFGGIKDVQAAQGAEIAVLKRAVSTLEEIQASQAATIAPIKLHPAVLVGIVLSPVGALAAILVSVFVALSK